ncbi:MAG: M20/M25/M40 family metallo-hydrolase [Bacillota bacterium]|nr:M20/M25/M40 family metallo-hydrolase [Bacillota bacterium]
MNNQCKDSKPLSLLYRLVSCPSTTGTAEEVGVEKELFNILSEMEYFKNHPENLMLHPIPGDRHGRCAVAGLVKGRGEKTVILLSHHDVVDTADYGPIREHALNPDRLASSLDPSTLDPETLADRASGGWIFGRGVADMKAGIALFISLMDEMSSAREGLRGNILFLSVPDEETNSAGMTGSVAFLNQFACSRGLEYIGLVNSEPCSFNPDGTYNMYIGSIGKLLPAVFCFGREAHAREPYAGINANLIMAELISAIEGNAELSDRYQDDITMPPANLKAMDLREAYSASTPPASIAFFNMLTYRRSPQEIISLLKETAAASFSRALETINGRIREYSSASGGSIRELEWKPRIYTYMEMYNLCLERHGETFKKHMEDFIKTEAGKTADERDLTVKIIKEVHSFCPDRNPKVVIAFSPPYYPHVTVTGKDKKEANTLHAVERLSQFCAGNFGIDLKVNRFFNGISDLSYCGVQDAEEVIGLLKPNMPVWGHPYLVPVDEIKKLDVPAVILGPWGKDLHKFTERLNLESYLVTTPALLRFYVDTLLNLNH